jgi:hypothetical protein
MTLHTSHSCKLPQIFINVRQMEQVSSKWNETYILLCKTIFGGSHPASYPVGTGGSLPGGKASGAWNWPLTSIQYRGQ